MKTICVIGASTSWTPNLVTDLITLFEEPLDIRFIDIDPKAAELCREWGEAANAAHGRKDRYSATTDRKAALSGADAVLITISTGGLDAMAHDLAIPEKYGIYATVGDTAGPGGWSRSIRNIPVFQEFGEDFEAICPKAFIANYTNPMSSLTATLQKSCSNPVTGLCHAYFEVKDVIQRIFGLEDWSPIGISIAGMNHYTWVVDFSIHREKGYPLLRQKLGGASLGTLLRETYKDDFGHASAHELCAELYDTFGFLPYPADRHTSEFTSFVLTGKLDTYFQDYGDDKEMETVRPYNVRRTAIHHRRESLPRREMNIRDMISGKKKMPGKTRETGSNMIYAYIYNKPFSDSVNLVNIGQIPGLPMGACVETLGTVDAFGVRPFMVEGIPENLLEIMRPHAICQKWITDGAMNRDKKLLLEALYREPQCAHLRPAEIRAMAEELFAANGEFIKL